MPERRFLGGDVTTERRQNRGDGGTDIRAENYRTAHIEWYPPFATHDEHNGKCGCRRLDNHCDEHTGKHENQHRKEAFGGVVLKELENFGAWFKVGDIHADKLQAHKQKWESDEELTNRLVVALLAKKQGSCKTN